MTKRPVRKQPTRKPKPIPEVVAARKALRVSFNAAASAMRQPLRGENAPPRNVNPFVLPALMKGVLPKKLERPSPDGKGMIMAMDASTAMSMLPVAWDYGSQWHGMWAEGIGFMGYPYLAELSQRGEYRRASGVFAGEMTRKWIRLKAKGDQDKSKQIEELGEHMRLHGVREAFREAIEHDGYFGRGQIFIDIGPNDDTERMTPLSISAQKIGKGGLKGFRVIDPTWTAPNNYNSRDPTDPTFYRPQSWFVMGRQIHTSRMLTMIARPLPDILKPAYNFSGLSLSQIMKPYVDNWLRTRQSVSDLINAFTVFTLATNLQGLLQGGDGADENNRLDAFNLFRSNRGLMVIDKDTETFSNISASLAGLHELQAQSQEHMSSIHGIPLVKFLGIQPSGLNASSEGEIRTWYDLCHAEQERICTHPLRIAMAVCQIDLWGTIDRDIDFEWVPLFQLDETDQAAKRKTEADTDAVLITASVIDPEEARVRIAGELDTPYHGLDLSKKIVSPAEQQAQADAEAALKAPAEKEDKADRPFGADAWSEADHPRGQPENAGEFGPGEGAKTTKADLGATKVEGGKRTMADGSAVPAHIAKLKIPPGWSNVKVNADPKAALMVVGRDAKNRPVAIYSDEHHAQQAASKFARITELIGKFDGMAAQNEAARAHPDMRDTADALDLIMKMGVRPGGEGDTGAEKKAYGATTLEGQHVVTDDKGNVSLQFTGKKGVALNLPVTDPALAKMLIARAAKAGPGKQIFPGTSAAKLLDHVHSLDGGGFKTKDFRTRLGTTTAQRLVAAMPVPKDEKAYRKAVMEVAKQVSTKLGNTPTIALQAYIAPEVFTAWKAPEMAADEMPDVRWGSAGAPLPRWRDHLDDDEDPDDEEMTETPPDVIAILGFDPAMEEGDDDAEAAAPRGE